MTLGSVEVQRIGTDGVLGFSEGVEVSVLKNTWELGTVSHVYNSSTLEQRQEDHCKFEASLICM